MLKMPIRLGYMGKPSMTGYMCNSFRHKCDDKGCYLSLLPSWDDIIARLPGKIRPTDIDGMVECSGHFLFIEEKSPGKSPEEAQRKAFVRLANQPNTTVVIMRPVAGSVTGMQAIWFPNPNGYIDLTRNEFLDWIEDWGIKSRSKKPRAWKYIDEQTT